MTDLIITGAGPKTTGGGSGGKRGRTRNTSQFRGKRPGGNAKTTRGKNRGLTDRQFAERNMTPNQGARFRRLSETTRKKVRADINNGMSAQRALAGRTPRR